MWQIFLQVSALSHGSCPDLAISNLPLSGWFNVVGQSLSRSLIGSDLFSDNIESWKIVSGDCLSPSSADQMALKNPFKAKNIKVQKRQLFVVFASLLELKILSRGAGRQLFKVVSDPCGYVRYLFFRSSGSGYKIICFYLSWSRKILRIVAKKIW